MRTLGRLAVYVALGIGLAFAWVGLIAVGLFIGSWLTAWIETIGG